MRNRTCLSAIAVACAMLVAAAPPSAAQPADPMEMTTDPADRAVLAEVASVVSGRKPEIAQLDAVLVKLPRPTPLRGMVQTVRAGVLAGAQDVGAAVTAVEEAIRLLPSDPRPKLLAVSIFTFSGSPQRAADLWIQASLESPEFARMSDPYIMSALIGRLIDLGDRSRADRVNARLGAIGFSAGLAPDRSSSALSRTREALRNQREDEAIEAVTAVSNPSDLLTLYVDRRYTVLWPRISEWAGADLTGQERRYLEELRNDWTAGKDFKSATAYARQLAVFDAHSSLVSLFLPMFDRLESDEESGGIQEDAEFLAPIVAQSLSRLGRKAEALALLAKVAKAMPSNDGGNALNIDAAYLLLASADLDWPQVIARGDAFLARARTLGDDINYSAVVQVEARRACALSRSGRMDEAQQAAAVVLRAQQMMPGSAMDLHLCRGDIEAAKTLLAASLEDSENRTWGLHFAQPLPHSASTPFEKLILPIAQEVRTDPGVQAIVNRVGRTLPKPLGIELPTGFDPFQTRARTRPLDPGET